MKGTGDAALVAKLLRQQSAIAGFGSFAFRQGDLDTVLTEAARACATGMSVPFAKVCRYREETNDLLVVAGYGWKANVVGRVVSRADQSSPQGRAFMSGEPSICDDVRREAGFELPPFYGEHGIISTIDVAIKSEGRPYGVLEIDNDEQHDYDQHDIDFLTGFANVLAEAVANQGQTKILKATIDRLKEFSEEKDKLLVEQDRLLDQKRTLALELQHRVRNNLQLIYGMLSIQLAETKDETGQRGIKAIARRVSTIAQVYDHLLGTEMSRTTDFGGYTASLCATLADMLTPASGGIDIQCEADRCLLDLDVVTALGIVIAEVVTNSYDHAFPSGAGTIRVSLRQTATDPGEATLTISDDGAGFAVQAESKRHGLGLVRRLVQQVRGTAILTVDHGSCWTITFPVPAVVAAIPAHKPIPAQVSD